MNSAEIIRFVANHVLNTKSLKYQYGRYRGLEIKTGRFDANPANKVFFDQAICQQLSPASCSCFAAESRCFSGRPSKVKFIGKA
jgi:hypothetical protein